MTSKGARLVAALLVFGVALATPLAVLPEAALWLEPSGGAVYALTESGRAWRIRENGSAEPLGDGWAPNFLLSCGERVYGVRTDKTLAEVAGTVRAKIPVSPTARPACGPGGRIYGVSPDGRMLYAFGPGLQKVAEASALALPDAEPVWLETRDRALLALLTRPTDRYPHGVLGDGLEAGGIALFDPETLEKLVEYRLSPPFVFEQRRVLPAGKNRLIATRSSEETGAGVVLFEFQGGALEPAQTARPLGRAFRWLNAFAATPSRVYAIRTPHLGGPLEVYRLPDLKARAFDLGLTNHRIGSRNLDLAVRLGSTPEGDLLVAPSFDQNELRVVVCGSACRLRETHGLAGALSSNLAALASENGWRVYAADASGNVYVFPIGR